MKKYLLFAGWQYYPSGGWSDFKGDFSSMEEATQFQEKINEQQPFKYEWLHIVDSEIGKVIYSWFDSDYVNGG